MGTNSSAIHGSVRAEASKVRRRTTPQPPPDMCWSIVSARPPSAAASQNRKASRYEWKNCGRSKKAPAAAAARPAAPTASARLRRRSRLAGGE
jgi:hypothetical protein